MYFLNTSIQAMTRAQATQYGTPKWHRQYAPLFEKGDDKPATS